MTPYRRSPDQAQPMRAERNDLHAITRVAESDASRAEPAFRANSTPAGPTESITLRDSRQESDVWPPTTSLTASYTHTASDVFVILKAGRSARGSPSRKIVAVDHRSVPRSIGR
jgi:hypothetical protein